MTKTSLEDLHAANIARQAEWCPDQVPDLSFRGNELGGECGEAQNVIKKLERERLGWRGSRATVEQLAEELADVVICADLCAITAGIDLAAAVRAKFNATSEKVGLTTKLAASTGPEKAEPVAWADIKANRKEFEKWIAAFGFPTRQRYGGGYVNSHTVMAWNAWQGSHKNLLEILLFKCPPAGDAGAEPAGEKQADLHGRAWVAAEYRVAGSPHEWTNDDALAMARFILAGPSPRTPAASRPDEQGEPVAWAWEEDCSGVWWPNYGTVRPGADSQRNLRNIRPLYAHPAPAASRPAVGREEIARADRENAILRRALAEHGGERAVVDALALLSDPGETQTGR